MYRRFFNLQAKPFQLSPDPRFFFGSKGHRRALSYLRYGIKQGEGFIIITGDVGTGKSTLVGMLFQLLAKANVVATQVVTTQMGADDMLRMVAAGFGLSYQRQSKAALLKNIEQFAYACNEEGKRVLLVVDEAQGLPRKSIEELRMLSNFQINGRSALQTFLLGQREFRATMRSKGFEQLRQRVIAAYHLKPLECDETQEYILHRLRTAGWQNDPSFDEHVFSEIYEATQGVPRKINNLCDRLLLFAYLEELHAIDLDVVTQVIAELREEHGDDIEADAGEGAVNGHANGTRSVAAVPSAAPRSAGAVNGNGAHGDDDATSQRLEAVESSMLMLSKAVREELTRLKDALDSRGPDERKGE